MHCAEGSFGRCLWFENGSKVGKNSMGRKKSSRKPVKKVVQKLDTSFNCLFCNHESSITCTLDKKNNLGTLYCKICGQSFQSTINALSRPVDVYTDWFDATEEVNNEAGGADNDDEDEENGETAERKKDDQFIEDDEEEEDGDYSD